MKYNCDWNTLYRKYVYALAEKYGNDVIINKIADYKLEVIFGSNVEYNEKTEDGIKQAVIDAIDRLIADTNYDDNYFVIFKNPDNNNICVVITDVEDYYDTITTEDKEKIKKCVLVCKIIQEDLG